KPVVVILVENLPVPFDRRVWQEALALVANGYDVKVVCPRTASYAIPHEWLDGVEIFRVRIGKEARRPVEYLREYGVALPSMFQAVRRISRRQKIDIIHACNPPDLLYLIAYPFVRW